MLAQVEITPTELVHSSCANALCVAEYRICRKSESHYDLTEECFQGKDPSRGGPLTLTDDSWIQYGNEKNRSHFKPTRKSPRRFQLFVVHS